MIKLSCANENFSKESINEALKPTSIGYQGQSNPKLPSGKPELSGENKFIAVSITSNDQDDIVVCVDFDDRVWDETHLEKFFENEKDAIKFGEQMLKDINSKLIDPRRVGKEYDFDIIG